MRTRPFAALGLVVLGGCLSLPKAPWTADRHEADVPTYGVRLVRPGMTEADVRAILGDDSGISTTRTAAESVSVHYTRDGATSKVAGCQTPVTTVTGDPPPSAVELAKNFPPIGAAPREVSAYLGAPACGYENEPGVVILVFPQKRVEVTFEKDRLKSWRWTQSYQPAVALPSSGVLGGTPQKWTNNYLPAGATTAK
jgi:hypothetical protein